MELNKRELDRGKKFVVGKWSVDYLVNFFSHDLAHIPATEFKSSDGRDFSALSFEFLADNTVVARGLSNGEEAQGTWRQTDLYEFEWQFDALKDAKDSEFLRTAQKLLVFDGDLTFSVGFLTIALKKI